MNGLTQGRIDVIFYIESCLEIWNFIEGKTPNKFKQDRYND